ncbi:extensin family protein [Magnetospirillum aberrantis SpK]|uniref:Extensin family protein n=1 Tax=Magnetospirillum aberrantis SpK TaxID=908842 RepID=A0A7C9V1L9_9PROT|nr:extensin family protein [Magnetospirillum aberrantis]NFV82313.1 extensin family protein [Magnetospirillum aberrantis SpK]
MRLFPVLVLLAALGACASPPPRVAAPAPPPVILDPDAACLQELARMGADFQPLEPFGEPGQGCGIANPVKVSATGSDWNRPTVLSCSLARVVARYQAEVLQPLAQQRFGQNLKRIHHAGTYDCRIRRNTTTAAAAARGSKGGRLSEHSKGMAIDLTAFELEDGTVISVKRDWRAGNAKAAFLKDVARTSCNTFNVVLTPNHDRFHQDHLHLDIGPYTLCGY